MDYQQRAREQEAYERQLAYGRKKRKKKREYQITWLIIIGFILLIFSLGVLFGWHLGTVHAVTLPDTDLESMPTPTAGATTLEFVNTSVKPTHSDLIVSDEGHFLSYDLQDALQAACTEYGVPYALALAVADQESRFDPDAKSSTNDHGLMQINTVNFGWLRDIGIEPLSYEGNIKGGVLILSKAVNRYDDYELALMAYNCGDTGAKRLWDAGTYSTKYSRAVMERYNKWQTVLGGM